MKKYLYLLILMLLTLSGCVNGPGILVDGVEEGKVYSDNRTITINQEKAVTYSMNLNGQPIASGHLVSQNGIYRLTISAKQWWMESKQEIVFTVDDRPPNPPTFKEEIQTGYFQEAKLELIEEDGVTYEVKLDGNPYDLHEPIRVEGEHELDILAIKENGKSVRRKDSFVVDNQTFTKEIVETFLRFHFDKEENDDAFLIKWMVEKVPVYVHGNPTNEDVDQLQTVLTDFNAWLPVQFEINKNKENNSTNHQINVYFVPSERFKEYGFTGDRINGNNKIIGFTLPVEGNSRDGLVVTTIGVDSTISQAVRNPTILHEFAHSLGMYNHFEDDQTSILYPDYVEGNTILNKNDRKIVEMLYRQDLLPGMTKEEIQKMWEPRIEPSQ